MIFLISLYYKNNDLTTLLHALHTIFSFYYMYDYPQLQYYIIYSSSIYFIADLIISSYRRNIKLEYVLHHLACIYGLLGYSIKYPNYIKELCTVFTISEITNIFLPFLNVRLSNNNNIPIPKFITKLHTVIIFTLMFFIFRFIVLVSWLYKQNRQFIYDIYPIMTILYILSTYWLYKCIRGIIKHMKKIL